MRNTLSFAFLAVAVLASCGDDDDGDDEPPGSGSFSFFISSSGIPKGGDFRLNPSDTDGLAGADAFCQTKAATAGAGAQTWKAYLSTSTVDARDRIGTGPWFNQKGVQVASSVANLHDAAANAINKETALDENGAVVNGRGDMPNQHDIVTGSNADGTKTPNHCNNWTSSATTTDMPTFKAQVGHHDRMGGGPDPTSWNAAHESNACSATDFEDTGGRGSIFCFAED